MRYLKSHPELGKIRIRKGQTGHLSIYGSLKLHGDVTSTLTSVGIPRSTEAQGSEAEQAIEHLPSSAHRNQSQVVMLSAKSYAVGTRVKKEAESLKKLGYDVTVLSWDRLGTQPRNATYDGIPVRGFRLINGSNFSKINYALATVMLQVVYAAWCLNHCKGKWVIHAHDVNTFLAGAIVRVIRFRDVKLIYDCHEFTPGAYAEWYSPLVGRVIGAIEKSLLNVADVILTVSPPIREYLSKNTRKPVVTIYNTVSGSDVPTEDRASLKRKYGLDGFVISYVGLLRLDVSLDEFVEAARQMKVNNSADGIQFLVVGDGPDLERIKSISEDLGEMVRFVPRVPHKIALEYVAASDLAYAIYRNIGENTSVAMPWKLFEAMGCGTPVLVRGGTYTSRFVDMVQVGLVVENPTADEISRKITWAAKNKSFLDEISKSSKKQFVEVYNWDSMEERLSLIYASLLR
jgi:glycosyltransferase involved in cell wall biosynthesis